MYCIHCGKEIDDDSIFCTNCGQQVTFASNSNTKTEKTVKPNAEENNSSTSENSETSDFNQMQDTGSTGTSENNITAEEVLGAFKEAADIVLETPARGRNDTVCPFCGCENCQPMQKNTIEVNQKNYSWGSGCCGMLFLGPFGLLCGLCGAKSNVKTKSELWWTCLKCGKQHISIKDALQKWDQFISSLAAIGAMYGVGFLILRYLDLGLLSLFMELFCIAAPVFGTIEFHNKISEELGESLIDYLSPDMRKRSLLMICAGVALVLIVGLFGVSILAYVLGE